MPSLFLFFSGHQLNVNEYTTQELLEKVQLADSLFDQGKKEKRPCVLYTIYLYAPARHTSMTKHLLLWLWRSPVSAPQEATLDSAFLVTASNMHAAKARAMKAGGSAFDIDDFVSKLITFMGGRRAGGGGGGGGDHPPTQGGGDTMAVDADEDEDEEDEDEDEDEPLDWERIGRKALAKSRRVPVMDFMCVAIFISCLVCACRRTLSDDVSFGLRGRRATGSDRSQSSRKSAR